MKFFKQPLALLLIVWLIVAGAVVGVEDLIASWEVPFAVIAVLIGYFILFQSREKHMR
ncbi:hypothetical protein SAMN02745116_02268 [Pilibacter termitis]|uniref:Uncharacterized protein n=1 Tax=Pilibacter termitis TaxID=263852 RepID=A0A1T4QPU4_9ENTE|nr:hypothetical protein [Pilibacter termitis]SKA05792.1 hypothetical protein SAMN02745116_02268 [Pilibacter termitis]